MFENRRTAGRRLAAELRPFADSNTVVVGVTRGGMVVAHAVAEALHLPLEALVVQKIGEPGQSRLPLGTIAEPDHLVLNRKRLRSLKLSHTWLEQTVAQGKEAVRQRGIAMRGGQARQELAGRHVIVVDDAAATGATLRVAVRAVRALGSHEVIVAVPVAPVRVVKQLSQQVERVVCLATPGKLIFEHVYYPRPDEVSDADIGKLLAQFHGRLARQTPCHKGSAQSGVPTR